MINEKIYTEDNLISEGGYGYVYRVHDENNAYFAMKKMILQDNQAVERASKEVDIWR